MYILRDAEVFPLYILSACPRVTPFTSMFPKRWSEELQLQL